ncbi:hypothetical protein C8Q74DRAFT_967028 [Fomes fomentarius]|nr:hypothetical protein C8Q74DRAFT_967028 [Fomes fomentarius]
MPPGRPDGLRPIGPYGTYRSDPNSLCAVLPCPASRLEWLPEWQARTHAQVLLGPLRHVAHLYLDCAAQLSSGSQSVVLRTPVVLPDYLDGRDEGKTSMVSVVVNLFSSVSRMFATTAHCYDAALDGNVDFGVDDIPKFYGCYLPVRRDGSMKIRAHDDGCNEECEREIMWASPILLLEECEETISAD